ncbi:hypothetical protein K491DRAFT_385459 [Lophiostoma macrostomum CBS 122681]|uniref:Uncharacterized protein n=1 Tax=Lophiostoma macrostomum CBS 122681 TaxID=1314788 RepID=A0A6A6TPQ3_9PLEO|nr:hypothetical protein K491DRAFT_385459 [Lophiostoma macrostomum CBS 122681]
MINSRPISKNPMCTATILLAQPRRHCATDNVVLRTPAASPFTLFTTIDTVPRIAAIYRNDQRLLSALPWRECCTTSYLTFLRYSGKPARSASGTRTGYRAEDMRMLIARLEMLFNVASRQHLMFQGSYLLARLREFMIGRMWQACRLVDECTKVQNGGFLRRSRLNGFERNARRKMIMLSPAHNHNILL